MTFETVVDLKNRTRPWLALLGWVMLVGCLGVLLGDLVGILVVEKHNPVSETISRLGIGKYSWIQDYGLDLFALGVFALAAAFGVYARSWQWWGLAVLTGLLGIDLLLIAEHDQYFSYTEPGATSIHRTLTAILYGLLLVILALFGKLVYSSDTRLAYLSFGIAVFWSVACPLYKFATPSDWKGLVERMIGLVALLWFIEAARFFTRRNSPTRTAAN